MTDGLTLEALAMVELARRHPEELAKLRDSLASSTHLNDQEAEDAPWIPCDRFNRSLSLGSLVLTAAGERGRIIRFDRKSERALVELDDGGTRMLRLGRIELRRGRPRKESFATTS